MVEKVHNKLVRDGIPAIIEANGEVAETRILSKEEYLQELEDKLIEEVAEYLESHERGEPVDELGELADIREVLLAQAKATGRDPDTIESKLLRALAKATGLDPDAIEDERQRKAAQRGGFEGRIYLISTRGAED